MGGAVFIVFLVASAAVIVCVRQSRSSVASTLCNLSLTLLPAVLLWVVIDAAGVGESAPAGAREKSWRVALSAFRFRIGATDSIQIGGSSERDHLVVPLLPAEFLKLVPRDKGLEIRSTPVGERGGGIAILRDGDGVAQTATGDGVERAFGGVRLARGAQLCHADAEGACLPESPVLRWDVRAGAPVLLDAAGAPLCKLPSGGRKNAKDSNSLRVFPLSIYARAGCKGSAAFRWSESQVASELLYWGPSDDSLYLLPSSSMRVRVASADGPRVVGGTWSMLVPENSGPGEIDVHLYEARFETTLPDASRPYDHVSRLQERRSFALNYTAQPASSVIEIFLHTPQVAAIHTRSSDEQPPQITISSRSGSPVNLAAGRNAVTFSLIGAPTAAQLLNIIQQPKPSAGAIQGCAEARQALIVQGMSEVACVPLGRWFALGDKSRYQAKIRISQIAPPGAWIFAILALAFANLLVREALETPMPARLVLGFTELLLALRTLVAFEAAAVDWKQEGTVAAAWIALLWLPAAFEPILRSRVGRTRMIVAYAFKLLVLIVGTCLIASASGADIRDIGSWKIWFGTDAGKTLFISLALCAVVAVLAYARRPSQFIRHRVQGIVRSVQRIVPRLASPLWGAFTPFAALMAIHSGLILWGYREQIPFGVRTAAFLIPALVLAWAQWDVAARSGADGAPWWGRILRIAVPFLPSVTFAWAHDHGAYVYFIALAVCLSRDAWPESMREWLLWVALGAGLAAMLLLAGGGLLEAPFDSLQLPGFALLAGAVALVLLLLRLLRVRAGARMWWSLPALTLLAGLVALQLGGWLIGAAHAKDRTATATTLQEATRYRHLAGKEVRLLDLIAPQVVDSIGARDAYGQRAALSEMRAYASSMEGNGWLHVVAPENLDKTHIDDNVTAVHLLAPFGRIGAFGVALFLVSFATAVWMLAARIEGIRARRAELASAVLVVTSLYMLLANIGATLFTGRNFYLLAVASGSDLLEGGLLIVIIFCALTLDAGARSNEAETALAGNAGNPGRDTGRLTDGGRHV